MFLQTVVKDAYTPSLIWAWLIIGKLCSTECGYPKIFELLILS